MKLYTIASVTAMSCLASLVACGGPPQCVEGTTQSCVCAGGTSGFQSCNSEGNFDPCVCDPSDAGMIDGRDAGLPADAGYVDANTPFDGSVNPDSGASMCGSTTPLPGLTSEYSSGLMPIVDRPRFSTVADATFDGYPDLVFATDDGYLWAINNGSGGFSMNSALLPSDDYRVQNCAPFPEPPDSWSDTCPCDVGDCPPAIASNTIELLMVCTETSPAPASWTRLNPQCLSALYRGGGSSPTRLEAGGESALVFLGGYDVRDPFTGTESTGFMARYLVRAGWGVTPLDVAPAEGWAPLRATCARIDASSLACMLTSPVPSTRSFVGYVEYTFDGVAVTAHVRSIDVTGDAASLRPDVNADGVPELVVRDDAVSALRVSSPAGFVPTSTTTTSVEHVADLDGDGAMDFIGNGALFLSRGLVDGAWRYDQAMVRHPSDLPFYVDQVVDLDADCDLDLVIAIQEGFYSRTDTYLGYSLLEDGIPGPIVDAVGALRTPTDGHRAAAIVDLDLDGDMDLVRTTELHPPATILYPADIFLAE